MGSRKVREGTIRSLHLSHRREDHGEPAGLAPALQLASPDDSATVRLPLPVDAQGEIPARQGARPRKVHDQPPAEREVSPRRSEHGLGLVRAAEVWQDARRDDQAEALAALEASRVRHRDLEAPLTERSPEDGVALGARQGALDHRGRSVQRHDGATGRAQRAEQASGATAEVEDPAARPPRELPVEREVAGLLVVLEVVELRQQ